MKTFQVYPIELQSLELEAIARRRKVLSAPGLDSPAASSGRPAPSPPTEDRLHEVIAAKQHAMTVAEQSALLSDSVGLCLSGGGIRSATFCLGVMQSLAKRKQLRLVDWLSTVSGGGYSGAFLGRFYDRLRDSPSIASDIVESAVANSSSMPVSSLRRHGAYLAPAGKSDLSVHFAAFTRNLFTIFLVLGLLAFTVYGVINGIRYGLLEWVTAIFPYLGGFSWTELPLGRLLSSAGFGSFWSPWLLLVELVLLLLALPHAIAFWLASQDETEGYSRPTLVVVAILLVAFLVAGVAHGFNVTALLLAAAILLAFPAVEYSWRCVRRDNAAVGAGGPKIEQLRARTRLTRDLGMWLVIAAGLLYFAIIDTLGHALYEAYERNNVSFAIALAHLGAVLTLGYPLLRRAARVVADRQQSKDQITWWMRLLKQPAISGLLAILLLAPPLIGVSYVAHAVFRGGDPQALCFGWSVTILALVLSLVIAWPWAMPVVNRSSLRATYAARLARAFLGASNPNRLVATSDDVAPGDDVDTLMDYKPYEAGGPLHLINVCINQTINEGTLRDEGERHGANFACSSLGVSIGKFFHARWEEKA